MRGLLSVVGLLSVGLVLSVLVGGAHAQSPEAVELAVGGEAPTVEAGDPPSVGVAGSVAVFTAEGTEPDVVRALEAAAVDATRCYGVLLRRARTRGARGIVRVRLPVGASRLTAEGPSTLLACARRLDLSHLASLRSRDLEASLVFTPGRHRRVVLGPVSGALEPPALAAIEAALHGRLPALEQLGAQTPGGARPRVVVRIRDGRVRSVSVAPGASEVVRGWLAVIARGLGGLVITGLAPGELEATLALRLTPPRQSPNELFAAPDCQARTDCPDRAQCVTGAMGGGIGCTGESCCGGDECSNGCFTASDCPRCRPRCSARGGEPGVCQR